MKKKRKKQKKTIKDPVNEMLKWQAYAAEYPSWDMDAAFNDFKAGRSIEEVLKRRAEKNAKPD